MSRLLRAPTCSTSPILQALASVPLRSPLFASAAYCTLELVLRPCRFTPFYSLSILALDFLPPSFPLFLFLFSPSPKLLSGRSTSLGQATTSDPRQLSDPPFFLLSQPSQRFDWSSETLTTRVSPTVVSHQWSYIILSVSLNGNLGGNFSGSLAANFNGQVEISVI